MTKQLLVVLGSAFVLTSCSNSGGGGSISPYEKPGNPAPESYLQSLFAGVKQYPQLIPNEAVIFNKIIDNGDVQDIAADNKNRIKFQGLLSSTGSQFAKDILKTCKVTDAYGNYGVSTGKIDDGISKTMKLLKMSTSGEDCIYLYEASQDVENLLKEESQNANSGIARQNRVITTISKSRAQIKDAEVIKAAGFKRLTVDIKTVTDLSIVTTPQGQEGEGTLTISGSISLELAGGDSIVGPVSGTIKKGNGMSTGSVQFKGTSAEGDIWIVMAPTKDGFDIYVNGIKRDVTELTEAFGNSLPISVN